MSALLAGSTAGLATVNSASVAHAAIVRAKSGDTIKSIAQDRYLSASQLAKANDINENTQLKKDQEIKVPDVPKTYTVKIGDTVSEVTDKYGLDTEKVLKLNGLTWTSIIRKGDQLKLYDDQSSNQGQTQNSSTAKTTKQVSVQGTTVGTKAANLAIQLAHQNIPYIWAGESLDGMDCSGLTKYVYAQLGINLGHNTVAQESQVVSKPVSQAQVGDLLFWGSPGSSYHVAIYIGNGQYVAAPQPGQNVEIENISSYFMPSFAGSVVR